MVGRQLQALRQKADGLVAAILGRGETRSQFPADDDPDVISRRITFSLIIRGGPSSAIEKTLRSLKHQGDVVFDIILAPTNRGSTPKRETINIPSVGLRLDVKTAPADLRAAIETASNDFIILLEAGDELIDHAIRIFAEHIRWNPCDVAYGDELWVSGHGAAARPLLKPRWSPELLTSYDYFGRATAIRRTVALDALSADDATLCDVGPLASEWDLKLRVTELTQAIERIPAFLCRRTFVDTDTPRALLEAEAPRLTPVLTAYWKRHGIDADVRQCSDGSFHARWPLDKAPLISVIIPNKNRAELLQTCVDGLYNKTDYKNFELIIVDNGSTEPSALALYEEIKRKSGRIVMFDEEFNYSRACNLGAAEARGDLLLFLNNDIEVIESGWLDELVREVMRPGVGVVGPKLLYPDGGIQHAGVAIGLFTLAAHVFHRAPHDAWGPFGSPDTKRNWMAVTGACHLMRRAVFDLVNGYDEAYLISYSDVVFCIDVVAAGFRTVYVPSAKLTHHEGASRGFTNPTNDQVLFARRLRALGIAEDPYFHPEIYKHSFIPQLREGDPLTYDYKPMKEDIDAIGGSAADADILDIHDDGAVAAAVERGWTEVIAPFDSTKLKLDADSGARILIMFARRRRDLRARFPRALSDGATGGFATWVKSEGLTLLGLDAAFGAAIDAAFAAKFGRRARQRLIYDEAFRAETPLFLIPNGRAATCQFLFHALQEEELGELEVWWFLIESAEDPQKELFATWAITPSWQEAVPDGGTAFGMVRLIQWVAATYGVTQSWINEQRLPTVMSGADQVRLGYTTHPTWRASFPHAMTDANEARSLLQHLSSRRSETSFLARAWLASQDLDALARDVARAGLNILGHFSYPSGLRISAESIVAGLHANDVGVSLRDVPVNVATDDPIGHAFGGFETYDTTLIHVQPEPLFDVAYPRSRLRPCQKRTYRIGYWYWEFDTIPASWDRAALDCDELWTATHFIAEGLRQRYQQPVKVFLPGIEVPAFDRHPRSYFGLAEDQFLFLFAFHMTSVMDRKNPFGLIKAFKEAFSANDAVKLVIKTTFGAQHPEKFEELRAAAADADILLIDKSFSRDEMLSLIAACDVYVSLHRSEGLGLSMAEAMLLGRPVVATRYSGNLDFMDDANSLLVDYKLVTLNENVPPYEAGQRWAQPSTSHAAAHMRRLYEDRPFAQALGATAKADLERRLNYRTTGAAIARRLREITAMT